jgi:uncharacterized phage protein (TIGR01671 family)
MRDILFRGKTSTGRWVFGSLIHAGDYCCILELEKNLHPMDWPYLDSFIGTFNGKATPVDPSTVGQYTGMKDKHDNKIFEGDFVRGMMDWGPAGMLESIVDIGFKNSVGGYRWNYFDMDTVEVTGNVYDNLEFFEIIGPACNHRVKGE